MENDEFGDLESPRHPSHPDISDNNDNSDVEDRERVDVTEKQKLKYTIM